MDRHILDLEQKAAIRFIVFLWKKVDRKPTRVDLWYPCYVQMKSAMRKMRKIITTRKLGLPTLLENYILSPITDYDMLEKHAHDFYADFVNHPSEYLETFICELERKAWNANRSNQKKNKSKQKNSKHNQRK